LPAKYQTAIGAEAYKFCGFVPIFGIGTSYRRFAEAVSVGFCQNISFAPS
jgi:hypothetical protein